MPVSGPNLELQDAIVEYISRFPELTPAIREVKFIYDSNLKKGIKFNGKLIRVGENLLSRNYKEIFGVITHVLMHYLFNHADRFKNLKFNPISEMAANLAMDAIANEGVDLIRDTKNGSFSIQKHEGAVTLEDIYPPEVLNRVNKKSLSSELVYQFILDNMTEVDMTEMIGEDLLGQDLESSEDLFEETHQKEGLVKSIRNEVITNLEKTNKEIGSNICNRLRELAGIIEGTKIDYKTQLKEFMIHHLTNRNLSSYDRLSRRTVVFLGSNYRYCPILPGVIPEKGIRLAAIAIDTSGSINKDELQDFLFNIAEIQEQTGCALHIICADMNVQNEYEIEKNDDIKELIKHNLITPQGGGGTDFRPAQRRMLELNADVCVYLTDGYGSYLDKDEFVLNNKIVWVLTQYNNWYKDTYLTGNAPSYGKFIQLES